MDAQNTSVITKDLLFGLINALVPDQTGSRAVRAGEVWFNPQPDPPGDVKIVDAWRAVGVSRTVISVAALSMGADAKDGLLRSQAMVKAFVDDFCGTSVHRIPLPPPWPRFDLKPNALDIVIAAAQFHSAANAMKDHPLSKDLADGADRLLQAALQRLAR